MQKTGHKRVVMMAPLPIELLPGGQLRKGRPQVALCILVKAALVPKTPPLPEDRQRQPLTATECGLVPRLGFGRQGELAKASLIT
jgi:hypothetical protein